MDCYTVSHTVPSVQTYCDLRKSTGLSQKASAAAAAGLPRSLFAVQITYKPTSDQNNDADDQTAGEPIAMGRVIGDGALFFTVVDIAVHPAHQGKGLGKRVVSEIDEWLVSNVPSTGQVGLVADGKAQKLYAQFGFRETSLFGSVAMARAY